MSQHNANVDLDIQPRSPQSLYEEAGEEEEEPEEEEEDIESEEESNVEIKRSAQELNVTEEYLKKLVAADKRSRIIQQEQPKPKKDTVQKTTPANKKASDTASSGMKLKPIPKVAPERRPTDIRYQSVLDRTTEDRQRSRDRSNNPESRDRKKGSERASHSHSKEYEREGNRRGRDECRGDNLQQSGRSRNVESRYQDTERRTKRSRSRSPKQREDKRQNRRSTPPPSSRDAVSQSQFEQLTQMIRNLTDRVNRQERKR